MDIAALASETSIQMIDIETDITIHTIDLVNLPFEICDHTPREIAQAWCQQNGHTLAEFETCVFEC